MKVVILKYNAGNIQSVDFAVQRLGIKPIISDSIEELEDADRVIIPGVGEAGSAMLYLKEKGLDLVIRGLKMPVLGICLGMQLMCKWSEEANTEGLGIFEEPVFKFKGSGKIPHMGWNQIYALKNNYLRGVINNSYFYFIHSYYVPLTANTIARCHYMGNFSAALHKDNFLALQFHPEKSGELGQIILKNFIRGF